jgi:hypothetical protein
MALGRPTKYDPKYCEELVEWMSKGMSFESFSGTIDTHRETLYEWAKQHKDFSDAKKLGREKSLIFYEKLGLSAQMGKIKGFIPSVHIFTMKNKHGWQDSINVNSNESTIKTMTLNYTINEHKHTEPDKV